MGEVGGGGGGGGHLAVRQPGGQVEIGFEGCVVVLVSGGPSTVDQWECG